MIKMLDFTNAEWVDEKEIAINDEWLDGILDGYEEKDVDHLVLQMDGHGKAELSVHWANGCCTAYRECGECWGNGVNFN